MDATAALAIVFAVGAAVVGFAFVAAIVYAIVQIARTEQLADVEKIVWIVAVLCAPVIGAAVWYFAGPHPLGLRLTRPAK